MDNSLNIAPIAVLVEDRPNLLKEHLEVLENHEIQVKPADSLEQALRIFEFDPSVDFMITDVNLDEQLEGDRSGLILAKKVRRDWPEMPIFGYSGRDQPNFEKEAPGVFTEFVGKGMASPNQLHVRFTKWRNQALDYRVKRLRRAQSELERLRLRYPLDGVSSTALHQFLPATLDIDGAIDKDSSLRKYRLHLVQAATMFPDPESPIKHQTFAPLAVWLYNDIEGVISELYQHPAIYAWGGTEDEALQQILMLMYGYHLDFKANEPGSEALSRLHRFLMHIFR